MGFVENEAALEDISLRVLRFSHQNRFTKAFIHISYIKQTWLSRHPGMLIPPTKLQGVIADSITTGSSYFIVITGLNLTSGILQHPPPPQKLNSGKLAMDNHVIL